MKLKVTTILGTRPEIIRLSCLIEKMDSVFDQRVVHTGQNFDRHLSSVFFNELGIRTPNLFLQTRVQTFGSFLASMLEGIEAELTENRPDAVVILGDTNSALSAIVAKRMGIPIYHLEAGNRSFDPNVPEEVNRKVVDHLADFNLAYTKLAKENLIREGLHPRYLTIIGSPLKEVFDRNLQRINESKVLEKLSLRKNEYFLVSAHRQENIDSPSRLRMLIDSLDAVAERYRLPIILSTHPRLQSKLEQMNGTVVNSLLQPHSPFGFIDYSSLQMNARLVISDSGSISEEAAILGFNAITIRDSMERPEALEKGSILMSGLKATGVLESISIAENLGVPGEIPDEYLVSDTSRRVISFISSTIRQHTFWSGLRTNHDT